MLTNSTDRLVWNWDPSGEYNAKSFYQMIMGGGKIQSRYVVMWKYKVPPTGRIFGYLLLRNKILTQEVLRKRHNVR